MFRLIGLIEISTVDRGVISMYGVRSGLFVAMNSRGRLYGTVGVRTCICIMFNIAGKIRNDVWKCVIM